MRFALVSDTHNEFELRELPVSDADVLVLAGDIETVKSHDNNWWDRVAKNYDTVIYIPGNHEYYNTYFVDRPILYFPDNVIAVFENHRIIQLGGVKIQAGCMWSDLSNPMSALHAKDSMNDYRRVKYSRDRYWFTPEDTNREFQAFCQALQDNKPDVVISHHAPSRRSLNPAYSMYKHLNDAYASEMDISGIKLWMHGHTHYPVDYVEQGCRVVSNPMGYPGEIDNFEMRVY